MNKDLNILVVEDDRILRTLMTSLLKAVGTVHTAVGGHEAISFLQNNPVDIIFSDVMMADGDGIELLDWVQTYQGKKRPIFVFVTGQSTITEELAIAKGAHSVIAKPFRMNALTDAVVRIQEVHTLLRD